MRQLATTQLKIKPDTKIKDLQAARTQYPHTQVT